MPQGHDAKFSAFDHRRTRAHTVNMRDAVEVP